jgi:hypothetical protein
MYDFLTPLQIILYFHKYNITRTKRLLACTKLIRFLIKIKIIKIAIQNNKGFISLIS